MVFEEPLTGDFVPILTKHSITVKPLLSLAGLEQPFLSAIRYQNVLI
jgi:hypothetical protein